MKTPRAPRTEDLAKPGEAVRTGRDRISATAQNTAGGARHAATRARAAASAPTAAVAGAKAAAGTVAGTATRLLKGLALTRLLALLRLPRLLVAVAALLAGLVAFRRWRRTR
ncbi:hypothetical protein [Thermomonospora cellulosilytica]|uniref:Uncharacterized protein n=1 Tax=Thermomonospora cellulosilytica TaxID=1411118 RepID=A0A7W3R8T6_9ACTN|nr:hypothetical protein [Thermomonospora cellulosilytica]MBA9004022.1 hypothetical protein [Thermomonospora cellulosilytica]